MCVTTINIEKTGIKNSKKIYYNLSYDELYNHEISPNTQDLEKGQVTSLGAVTVDTGKFTGRSAKDKYIVKDESIYIEEYARGMIKAEEMHAIEVSKMLKDYAEQ